MNRGGGDCQDIELKSDPGSKVTGIALVGRFQEGNQVIWGANLKQNPEISGVEYQQGSLMGYEVKEYLLEKWGRECTYRQAKEVRLEIDHIVPKSQGGTDRVGNLLIACRSCNEKKGPTTIQEFLNDDPSKLTQILKNSKTSLKDTASVNATRHTISTSLNTLGLPITSWSGGITKFNRCQQGFPKDHWVDAACVGESGSNIIIPKSLSILYITAMGRGSRQQCRVNTFGFPRTTAKAQKRVFGFQTGDLVHATVDKGKKAGRYSGRVAVRSSGNFNIKTAAQTVQGIKARYCQLIQKADGYHYQILKQQAAFPPRSKGRGLPCRNEMNSTLTLCIEPSTSMSKLSSSSDFQTKFMGYTQET